MPDANKEKFYRILAEFDVPAIEMTSTAIFISGTPPEALKAWDTDGA
jgi:hypothetical protein